MVDAAPDYSTLLSDTQAAMEATAVVTANGTTVPLDQSPGSYNLGLAVAIALNMVALYRRQDQLQAALDYLQATGADLDRLVAPWVTRNPATAATVAVLATRQAGQTGALAIPVGYEVYADNPQGGASIAFSALQGASEPAGVALTLTAGVQAAWFLAQAEAPDFLGVIGNVPAGAITQPGSSLPGLLSVGNPPAQQSGAPTATVVGTAGTAVRLYRVVGNGATGTTLPSDAATLTTAPDTLSGTNYVHLDWTPTADGASTPGALTAPPVSYGVLVSLDSGTTWLLLTTTTATTYDDQGSATPTGYTLPTLDTSNQGQGGAEEEDDGALRTRAEEAWSADDAATESAVETAVLAVDGVADVLVQDYGAGAAMAYVLTTAYPPAATVEAAVIAAIQANKAAGIAFPTPGVIQPTFIQPATVDVAYTVLPTGTVADTTALEAALALAINAPLADLGIGDPVRYSVILAAMMAVPGVAAVSTLTLTAAGVAYTGADVPGSPLVVYRPGAINPTVG